MSSPSRFCVRSACKIAAISALISIIFIAGCTTSPATPEVTLTSTSLPAGAVSVGGGSYSFTLQASGGTAPYTYTVTTTPNPLTAAGLSLSSSGAISGSPTTAGTYSFTVQVTDSQGHTNSFNVSLAINAKLTIGASGTLGAVGIVGGAYPTTSLSVTGGSGSLTCALNTGSGPLPAGLGFSVASGTCNISGTIGSSVTPGSYSFTVKATDSDGDSVISGTINITVNAAVQIATPSLPLPTGVVGVNYPAGETFTVSGGTGTGYTWTVATGSLPTGLSLSAMTGASVSISSTMPTTAGTYPFTLKVTDSQGDTATTAALSITINPAITVTLSPTSAVTLDETKTQAVTATVANDPSNAGVTWSAVTGLGTLSNSTTTGTTYNAPTTVATASTATFTATSKTDPTKSATFTVNLVPPPAITTTTLPAGNVNAAYTATVNETGGVGPYTWSIVAAPAGILLPPPVSTTSSVTVGGAPTVSGNTLPFTIQVTDAQNLSVTSTGLTITVYPQLQITAPTSPLTTGVVGVNYTAGATETFTASGGSGAGYTWSVINVGSTGLPPGLALSATTGGSTSITAGPPTTAGTYTFQVKLTDSVNNTTTTGNLVVTINPPITVTLSPTSPVTLDETKTQAVTATVANDPSNAGVTWSGVTGLGTLANSSTTGITYNAPTTVATASTATFTATSKTDPTKSATFTVNLVPPPTITTTTLPAGNVNGAYTAAVNETGGVGPYTWAIVTAPTGILLPTPISTTSSVTVGGSPTVSGNNLPFTIQVTDAQGISVTSTGLTVTVYPQLQITAPTSPLTTGVVGVNYTAGASETFTAVGGSGTGYQWSVVNVGATGLPPGLALSPTTGGSTSITAGPPTTAGTYTFQVKLTDSVNNTTTTGNLVVTINPAITVTLSPTSPVTLDETKAQAVTATVANDPSNAGVTWSGVTGLGTLANSSTTGITYNAPTTVATASTATFTATSKTDPTKNATFTVNLVPPPTITTTTLPAGNVNGTYSATVNETGGVGPYTWALVQPYPAGLTLAPSTGSSVTVQGAPTVSGNNLPFTIQVIDAQGLSVTSTGLTVTVYPQLQITAPTSPLPTGNVGLNYTAGATETFTASGGSGAGYTWSVVGGTGLPPGLALSATTGGSISITAGPPTTAGPYTFQVKLTDSVNNTTTTGNLAITINPPITVTLTPTPPISMDQNMTQAVTATVANDPANAGVTWSGLTGLGTLTNSSTTGITYNAPATVTTGSTATFTATSVTDSTKSATYTVNLVAPPTIGTVTFPTATEGTPITPVNLTVTGGVGPFMWSVVSLPSGLSLSSTSGTTISVQGTPTTSGSSLAVQVKVTDAKGLTFTVSSTITINPPPISIGTPTLPLPGGIQGTPYPTGETFAASGGTGAGYTWSVIPSGGLPPGLSLSSTTGSSTSITGTPNSSASGTYPFSLQLTDSGSDTTSVSLSITVSVPTCASNCTLSGNVTVGGQPLPAVTITITGPSPSTVTTNTTTNSSGAYSFTGLAAGSYTVAPSLTGYTFSPASPNVSLSSSTTTQNFTATPVQGSFTISGTLTYTGDPATGNIIIRVFQGNCTNCGVVAGTAIPNATGQNGTTFTALPFTVRGLPSGSYYVTAEIDTLGNGTPNESNPEGSSSTFTLSSNLTVPLITIANRTPESLASTTPSGFSVSPSNEGAVVMYNPVIDNNGEEIATSYKVTYGTGSSATNEGSQTFTAQGKGTDVLILPGIANGATNFELIAINSQGQSLATSPVTVTLGAGSGFNVTGMVTFTGTLPSGVTLYAGVYSNSTGQVYSTAIQNPVSPQTYTVTGVPAGSYQNFAIIDVNKNGEVDAGDLENVCNYCNPPAVTVSGNTTGANVTLSSASAIILTPTAVFGSSGQSNSYSIGVQVNFGTKLPISMTMLSGPNVAVPYDMNADEHNANYAPIFNNSVSPGVGNTYEISVTFSDGSTQLFSIPVTAVLALPGNLQMNSPVAGTATVPVLNWTAPSPAPTLTPYTYSVNLNNANGTAQENWSYSGPGNGNGIPSTQTSVEYDVDGFANPNSPLALGGTYNWTVQVQDNDGNSAQYSTSYMVPGGGAGPGVPSQLAFYQEPDNATANAAMSQIEVAVEDSNGNLVSSATTSITLAIGTGSGTLNGTKTVSASGGVAVFSGLSITSSGTGDTLTATANGVTLTGATSTPFNVAGTATQLAFTEEPDNSLAGGTIPTVQVSVEDASGRLVTNSNLSITIILGTGSPSGVLSGTTVVSAVSGIATFSGMTINNAGTGYTLEAMPTTTSPISFATSTPFSVETSLPTVSISFPHQILYAGDTVAKTITFTVANDASGDSLTTQELVGTASCSTMSSVCGTFGSVSGTSGSGTYTMSYTLPASLTSPTTVTLTASSSLLNSFGATASFTVYPAGSVVVTIGGVAGAYQLGGSASPTLTANVYNDNTTGSTNGVELYLAGSGYICPSGVCGNLTLLSESPNTTTTGTTGIPFTSTTFTYKPPASLPTAPYDRPMIVAYSNKSNPAVAESNFEFVSSLPGNLSIAENSRLATAPAPALSPGYITLQANVAGGVDTGVNRTINWSLTDTQGNNCEPTCGTLANPAYTRNGTAGAINATIQYTPPSSVPNTVPDQAPTITATLADNSSLSDHFSFSLVNGACGTGNESILSGQYAFLLKGGGTGVGYTAVIGSINANGSGTIMSGFEDVNGTTGPNLGLTVSGTYSIGPDNRGCMTLTNQNGGITHFRFALGTLSGSPAVATQGTMEKSDDYAGEAQRVAGILLQQNPNDFNQSSISGTYVFGRDGIDLGGGRIALAGVATANAGTLSGITLDYDDYYTGAATLTGGSGMFTLASGAPGGRGTSTTTIGGFTDGFVEYVVSSSEILTMSTDPMDSSHAIQSGPLMLQTGTFTTTTLDSKNYVLYVSGIDNSNGGNDITLGQSTNGTHGATTLTLDENDNGSEQAEEVQSATFDVTSTGRTTITSGGGSHPPVFYLIDSTQAFIVGTDSSDSLGYMQQQTPTSFSTSTISGQFFFGGSAANDGTEYDAGTVVFAPSTGTITGTDDTAEPDGYVQPNNVIGAPGNTYSFSTSSTVPGQGNVGTDSLAYIISATKVIFMNTSTESNQNPAELFVVQH